MTGVKKNALAAMVLALALWPVAHLFLATRYQVDPWEFMGWGMYALPSPQVHVRMEQLLDGRSLLVRPSDASLARLDAFAARRTRLGELVAIDALGADLLALNPEMDGVAVIVRRWALDPETAYFDFEEERHHFER